MTKRRSKQSSPGGALIGAILVIIAAIIFALTGIDLTGGALTQPTAAVTDVRQLTAPASTPATQGTNTPRPPTVTPVAPGTPMPLITGQAPRWRLQYPVEQRAGLSARLLACLFYCARGNERPHPVARRHGGRHGRGDQQRHAHARHRRV